LGLKLYNQFHGIRITLNTCIFFCIIDGVSYDVSVYEGCPESIRQFWISREPVAWPWCNFAANQRRPYRESANSHSTVGL